MYVRDYAVGRYTIRIAVGDITDLHVDAIANSENEDMRMDSPDGRSVSAAIRRRGGECIAQELARQGPIGLGQVRVTSGGALPVRYVLHPAVVWARDGLRYTDGRTIEATVRHTLGLAEALGLSSVALPAFGVGTGRYPDREAARLIVRSVLEFFTTAVHIDTVVLALKDPRVFASIFEETLTQALGRPSPLVLSLARSGPKLSMILEEPGAVARLAHHDPDPIDLDLARRRFASVFESYRTLDGDLSDELAGAGSYLMDTVLGPEAREVLRWCVDRPLLLRLTPDLAGIPWELAHDGTDHLCRRLAMSRQTVMAAAATTPQGDLGDHMRVLLVSDPTGDLPRASDECRHLLDMMSGARFERLECQLLGGDRADLDHVVPALEGQHVIHFAGHISPDGTGWSLAGGGVLTADRFKGRTWSPTLVFASACGPGNHPMDPAGPALAHSLLSAGVRSLLMSVSPVRDDSAQSFAIEVHSALQAGVPLGECVRRARNRAARLDTDDLGWALWVLHGDPSLRWTWCLPQESPP